MATINVFIIDDNQKFLETALNYLNSSPYVKSIGWSTNFSDATKKLELLNYDLILVDYSTPDISCVEAARIMKDYNNSRKIYFLSLHDDFLYKEKAIDAGADGYIPKTDFINQIESVFQTLT